MLTKLGRREYGVREDSPAYVGQRSRLRQRQQIPYYAMLRTVDATATTALSGTDYTDYTVCSLRVQGFKGSRVQVKC